MGSEEIELELTLNYQDRTNNSNIYKYINPGVVLDVKPERGPTKGGTEVFITGSNFTDTGEISCRFHETTVKATRLSSTLIKCISPPHTPEELVDLVI
jgi:hypothetical protein